MVPNPIPRPEEETLHIVPPIPPDGSPDPALIARRVSLTRRLLTGAIDRYKQTRSFFEEVEAAMPQDFRGDPAKVDSPDEECRAWGRLLRDAESDYHGAENALAILINNLSDDLAPEGQRRGRKGGGSGFRERAVSIDGQLYVLVEEPADFDDHTPLIAMVSNDRMFGLDD
jgi:hypothetical protein